MLRVLIIDDDEAVAHVFGRLLQLEGCEVTVVTSAIRAQQALEAGAHDVVVCDYKMPVMNGATVLALARRLMPQARRVLISGALVDVEEGELDEAQPVTMLQKPVESVQLIAAVHGRKVQPPRMNTWG